MRSLARGTTRTPFPADNLGMEPLTIECLRCGHSRAFNPGPQRSQEFGACPRCNYVGWAYSDDLSERTRRILRDVPLERRLVLRPV